MKNILFRTTSLVLLLAVCFAPAYAHHGTTFLTKVMEADAAEVKLAELAQTKAQDPRVKNFAAMIVKDHTMELDKMQMLLQNRNNANVTTHRIMNWREIKISTMHQQAFDKMAKMSGAEFDREFMRIMMADHQAALRDFETHARSHGNTAPTSSVDYAKDTDTATFAREALPTLKNHLEMAKMIQKEMKAGTPVSQR